MASFSEKIKITIDVVNKGATSQLSKFRSDLKNTQGVTGKFKVAASGAFDYVKAHAAQFAFAAGASLVAFGVKSVKAFTDAALAAGRFAEATGLSTEEASKWISAGDDIGISAAAIEKAFVKMTVEMGKGHALFDQYGIDVVKAADGTDDMNATMLNAIDVIGKIPNASERARVAQQLFGRGYAEVAELVMNGSEGVIEALESTSDAQIFDQDEVDKARNYRRVMDEFNDVITDVTMTLGEELTPALAGAIEGFTALKDVHDVLPDDDSFLGGVIDAAKRAINPVDAVTGVLSDLGESVRGRFGVG
jgi:hypothetical protein